MTTSPSYPYFWKSLMKQLTLSSSSSQVREDMGLSSPDTTPLPTWQDGCWASHRDLEKVAAGHRIPWSHPGSSISSIAPSSGYVPGDMATPALLTAATCVTIHIYFCVDCSKKVQVSKFVKPILTEGLQNLSICISAW